MTNEVKTEVINDMVVVNPTVDFFNQLDVLKFFLNNMTEEEQKNIAIFMQGVQFAKNHLAISA